MQALNEPSVVVRDVSKTYLVNRDGSEHGLWLKRRGTKVEALKSTNFVVLKGESIGIIGKNGSGKSTLLKMIAGQEKPTSGEILVSSEPALLTVSAALQQHLTGMENIRLGLLASGLTPEAVSEVEDSVANWADIGDAVHRPMNTYSSGMGARLKFSIATAVKPDILLVDEALATGDTAFAARAKQRMDEFLADAATIFIVSHAPTTIRENCTRAIWIHEGQVIADGDAYYVSSQYGKWSKAVSENDRVTAGMILRRMAGDYVAPRILFDTEAAKLL